MITSSSMNVTAPMNRAASTTMTNHLLDLRRAICLTGAGLESRVVVTHSRHICYSQTKIIIIVQCFHNSSVHSSYSRLTDRQLTSPCLAALCNSQFSGHFCIHELTNNQKLKLICFYNYGPIKTFSIPHLHNNRYTLTLRFIRYKEIL
jgi:hypothetical protein